MNAIKQLKIFTIAMSFFAALLFLGCDNSSSIVSFFTDDSLSYASGMQQTQAASAASSEAITVFPTTKTLILTGASGKTIYMARTNARTKSLAAGNTRAAKINSGISGSKEISKSALAPEQSLKASLPQNKDPHAVLYENFMSGLKSFSSRQKTLAPIQASVKSYNVGDTETFYSLDPSTFSSTTKFITKTYKLLVQEASYNIWVDASDTNYTGNAQDFLTAATTLGEKFYSGYSLVSHIYGEPSSYVYSDASGSLSKYKRMSEYSKTGDKINIMLYSMLEKGGVYGFVCQGDYIYNYDGSNEGRFLYMDSKTLMEEPMEAYSTALHEFSHAISFNVKTLEQGVEWTYWYGEMLAMMCEDMMQSFLGILDTETDGNLGHTAKARLPSANYIAWENGLTGQTSATYAAAFQLGAWLGRKFGGVQLIKELATNGKVDFDSILLAIQTVKGKSYTTASLLQEMAEDLIVHKSGAGFDQDAATYTDSAYTHSYSGGTYNYPLTAINLWDAFYAWCDTESFSNIKGTNYISNESIAFSALPSANIYKKADWKGSAPTIAYKGPLLLSDGGVYAEIGPQASMTFKLGTATADTVSISFSCVGGYAFGDTITIWAK